MNEDRAMVRRSDRRAADATRRVLVCGASFAGLSTAYWLNRLGYEVTVVEVWNGLKTSGTPVNIEGETVEIVRRMGLLEQIKRASLPARPMQFMSRDGSCLAVMSPEAGREGSSAPEYEIERDELLQLQFEAVKDEVEFVFGDSIESMEEREEEVAIRFRSGDCRSFALVFGCDGNHSAVRRMCFGDERSFSVFLQFFFSISIVNKLLLEENTSQLFNAPGKTVMLNAYHGKTDIGFCYFSEEDTPYDRRDQAEQRRLIQEHFDGEGWRTSELLREVQGCKDFYFDKLCQIKMPTWTKGRVALVGDAAYCASPAAGFGGSLAIIGATALADAFQRHPHDFRAAFQDYNEVLRPFVEKVQLDAVRFGLETFAPRSEEAIAARNARFAGEESRAEEAVSR